jgi:hypothetical protein
MQERGETEEIRRLHDRLQAACNGYGPRDRVVLLAVLELLDDIIDAYAPTPNRRLEVTDEICGMLRAPIAADHAARQRLPT